MSKNYRFSIDTFYFGLQISALECQHLLEFINNYLFFFTIEKIEYNFSKNRFYHCQYCDPDHGINIFFHPRKKVKNDYMTFELQGKFFRDIIVSKSFVDFILETFEERVNFQRLDVAIDLIYDDVKNVPLCEKTHLLGFPFPDYSKTWRYQRIPFEMYGRLVNNSFFINMVYQGKNDIRLRVYDKKLDLLDKYETCYSKYYMLDIKDTLVYRIELQMRSDKLKNYISQFLADGIDLNYFNLVSSFCNYIFDKYVFENVDYSLSNIKSYSTYVKREPDLLNRIDYFRKRMFSFYEKFLKYSDEYNFMKNNKNNLNFLNNSLKKENFNKDVKSFKSSGIASEDLGNVFIDFYYEKK